MAVTLVDSPLATMVERTPTDFWNDSCSLRRGRVRGRARGHGRDVQPGHRRRGHAPERETWEPRVRELAAEPTGPGPRWSSRGRSPRRWASAPRRSSRPCSTSTRAARAGSASRRTRRCTATRTRMLAQGERFHRLAPNIQVKFPTTAAGIVAIEEATARGVAINSTVGFTVSQALAVGEAVERGLRRFEAAGGDPEPHSRPVCTLMVGRLDDWVKVLVERDDIALDPAAADWAGIAAFKRAYGIYQERGYRTRLLAAAMRHRLHWTELVGGGRGADDPARVAGPVQRERHRPPAADRRPGRPGVRRRPADPRAGLPARLRARRPRDRRVRHVRPDRAHVALVHRGATTRSRDRSATSCCRTRTCAAADRWCACQRVHAQGGAGVRSPS